MLIVYDSMTGNVRRFVDKLDMRCIEIDKTLLIEEPYVLITYTIGFGQVPEKVVNFLQYNHHFLKGVAASGNRNWGNNFARSADIISEKYNVPIILKFELSGLKKDIDLFIQEVRKLVTDT